MFCFFFLFCILSFSSNVSFSLGSDPSGPILLGCNGIVFDVTSGASFYGPDGPYGVFAGKDASRGLATMQIEYTSAKIDDLSASQKATMKEVS